MQAGELRHKITIISVAKTTDSEGIAQETTETVRTCYAAIEHRNPSEKWAHGKIEPDVTDLFTVRYSSDVTREMRIVYSSKTYEILGVEDIRERHEFLLIQAKVVI